MFIKIDDELINLGIATKIIVQNKNQNYAVIAEMQNRSVIIQQNLSSIDASELLRKIAEKLDAKFL